MASKPTKPEPAPPISRKLYTPAPVQYRVIARHTNGESNREIARRERMDRGTVSRILSQEELVATLADQQSRLLKLGYSAIALLEQSLECDDIRTAVKAAIKILEGSGVINKRGLQGTIDDARRQAEFGTFEIGSFVWPPVEKQAPLELEPVRVNSVKRKWSEELEDDYGPDDGGSELGKEFTGSRKRSSSKSEIRGSVPRRKRRAKRHR